VQKKCNNQISHFKGPIVAAGKPRILPAKVLLRVCATIKTLDVALEALR
jgi:hypothetical protein